jgi:hypothetical protein
MAFEGFRSSVKPSKTSLTVIKRLRQEIFAVRNSRKYGLRDNNSLYAGSTLVGLHRKIYCFSENLSR